MAFTHYDVVEPIPKPTIAELIAALSAQQRGDILKAYRRENVTATKASRYLKIKYDVIDTLFREMDQIDNRAKAYMRQQVVVTPAVYDQDGNLVTPVVYNDPIVDVTDLKAKIYLDFSDDLSVAQVGTLINALVEDSKHDSTGDWTFYSTEVVK